MDRFVLDLLLGSAHQVADTHLSVLSPVGFQRGNHPHNQLNFHQLNLLANLLDFLIHDHHHNLHDSHRYSPHRSLLDNQLDNLPVS